MRWWRILPEDIQDELSELLCCYSSLEELCEHADEIIHYPDCNDMTDVAYYFIDECLSLGGDTRQVKKLHRL